MTAPSFLSAPAFLKQRERVQVCADGVKRHFGGILRSRAKRSVTSTAPLTSALVFSPDADQREKKYKAHRQFGDRRGGVISARTYFYADEAKCDNQMETFINCIKASGEGGEALTGTQTGWGLSVIPVSRGSLSGWIFSH